MLPNNGLQAGETKHEVSCTRFNYFSCHFHRRLPGRNASHYNREPKGTKELLKATVLLDSKKVGELQFMMLHGTWYEGWLQKKYGKSPMHDMVALNITVSRGFTEGAHEVKVTKYGYKPYVKKFAWPPASGERVFIYADAAIDPVTVK